MTDHPLKIMQWLEEMGDDVHLSELAINRYSQSTESIKAKKHSTSNNTSTLEQRAAAVKAIVDKSRNAGSTGSKLNSAQSVTLPDENAVKSALKASQTANSLEELKQAMSDFKGCNLQMTAKNMVFADGNPEAKLMLIGEAPGRDEDIQGLPFVGRSGQLLDKMLSSIGLDRTSVYITNVIPWRPPGNRAPTTAECEICQPFINRHIELISPKIIVMIGGSSHKMLMDTSEGILKSRGRWSKFKSGGNDIDALATLHPAYLLRQPAQKRLAWHDLLKIKEKLEQL